MSDAPPWKPGQKLLFAGCGVLFVGCALFGGGHPTFGLLVAVVALAAIVVGIALDTTQPLWLRAFTIIITLAGAPLLLYVVSE